METNNGKVHDAYRAIKDVLEGVKERTIPQLGKYRLAKLHRMLEPHYTAVENLRAALIQELGEERFFDDEKTQSKGWGIDETGPGMKAYVERWNDLRAFSVSLPGVSPIPLGALGDHENGLKLVELRLLDEFIDG